MSELTLSRIIQHPQDALSEIGRLRKENSEIEKRVTCRFCVAQTNQENKIKLVMEQNDALRNLIRDLVDCASDMSSIIDMSITTEKATGLIMKLDDLMEKLKQEAIE
jgi:hypothetical protein